MPWLYVFASLISYFAIGAGRGVLRAFVEVAQTRMSLVTGTASKDDPAVVEAIARLAVQIETAQAMYEQHIARQADYVARDEVLPMPEAMLYRAQLTSALRRIAELVDAIMLLQGSRATDLNSRITRTWLDLAAARTHGGNDPAKAYNMFGAMLANA
jgi:3-hydroxy-9,10-secoandrosta-1,3,5(10)-triene-9,17-dione monooxygenase